MRQAEIERERKRDETDKGILGRERERGDR